MTAEQTAKLYSRVGAHVDASTEALEVIGDTFGAKGADPEALLAAAKTLEAAGCYIRRALAKVSA